MSVGSNIIRGTIRQGVPTIPVFRFELNSSIVYGFFRRRNNDYCVALTDELMKFDGGGICAASTEFEKGKLKIKIAETLNIATSPKIQSFVNLTTDGSEISTSISSIGSFSVSPIGMSGDGHNIYAGVWYHLTFGGNKLKVQVWTPEKFFSGFPGAPDFENTSNIKSSQIASISFIPFTRDVSLWINSTCTEIQSQQFALQRFTSWVRSRYMGGNPIYDTQNCNLQTLNSSSKNCIFVGNNCNLNIGYDYCMPYEACGKCFGKCENGGKCLSNSFTKKFSCEMVKEKPTVTYHAPQGTLDVTPKDETPAVTTIPDKTEPATKNLGGETPITSTTQSSKSSFKWIILILIVIIIIAIAIFVIYHRKKTLR